MNRNTVSTADPVTRLSTLPGVLEMEMAVTASHTSEEAWEVITDYDRLDSYMPYLRSRTVGRTNSTVIVEQTGTSSMLGPLRFSCTLEFVRESPERLLFRQIKGSLRRFDGYWSVISGREGARISYRARAEHGFPLPGQLVALAVRRDIEKIMPAIVAELGRRAAPVDDPRVGAHSTSLELVAGAGDTPGGTQAGGQHLSSYRGARSGRPRGLRDPAEIVSGNDRGSAT